MQSAPNVGTAVCEADPSTITLMWQLYKHKIQVQLPLKTINIYVYMNKL